MYDALLAHQDELAPSQIARIAEQLELDTEPFWEQLRRHEHAARVAEDVASADSSGVSGTPTFFINGRRHYGAYDLDTLSQAVRSALRRARLTSGSQAPAAPAQSGRG